ncbi:MAG: ABC transporter substrate binding protein, partial [Chloroflexi bacterium]|nr:ABC transporter substrate binding protein [Chloroflexota bacterium]
MQIRMLLGSLVALLMLAAPALAQDEKPTIAFLRYAGTAPVAEATAGILDSLEAYGYLTSAERAALNESFDLNGEKINLLYRDAGFDLPSVNLMVEEVIDKGADALVTITTQVAQIAVNATRDMEDPPAILFSLVTTPFTAGIAESPCIKPAHVAGTQPVLSFADYVPLVLVQNPDIKIIGTIVTPDQPTSVVGAQLIQDIGASLGLTVEVASAISLADLSVAAESLLGKGVEAIVLSVTPLTLHGTPVLVQMTAEYGIPLYAPIIQQVYRGVTVGAGFYSFYDEGVIAATILNAHLSGEVDIADIAINQSRSFGIAINLDTAAEQGIEISHDLLEHANFVIENGERSEGMA